MFLVDPWYCTTISFFYSVISPVKLVLKAILVNVRKAIWVHDKWRIVPTWQISVFSANIIRECKSLQKRWSVTTVTWTIFRDFTSLSDFFHIKFLLVSCDFYHNRRFYLRLLRDLFTNKFQELIFRMILPVLSFWILRSNSLGSTVLRICWLYSLQQASYQFLDCIAIFLFVSKRNRMAARH